MAKKKVKPPTAWYEDPNIEPIHTLSEDGQEVIKIFSNYLGNHGENKYAIIKMSDDGFIKEVIELENGQATVREFDW
jgi:hypothetical protein